VLSAEGLNFSFQQCYIYDSDPQMASWFGSWK
jgi:hypothetical protein